MFLDSILKGCYAPAKISIGIVSSTWEVGLGICVFMCFFFFFTAQELHEMRSSSLYSRLSSLVALLSEAWSTVQTVANEAERISGKSSVHIAKHHR